MWETEKLKTVALAIPGVVVLLIIVVGAIIAWFDRSSPDGKESEDEWPTWWL